MSINTLFKMKEYIEGIEQIFGVLNQEDTILYLRDEQYPEGMIAAYVTTFFSPNLTR